MPFRPRIAYCSPVNPVESGISDYSEELLPYLGQYADITLVVDDGVKPGNEQITRHLAVESISKLSKLHHRQPFDAIIYHMGNSPAHSSFLAALEHTPGVIVLHDYVLHHLLLWHAANRRKDLRWYRNEVARRYGEAAAQIAAQMERGQFTDAVFDLPLSELVIERATALIGHSQYVVDRVRQVRPDLPTAIVPMGVPLPALHDRTEARRELGLPLDAPIWASFGHINPYKRVEQALRAFRHFRTEHPAAVYVLVGSVSPNYNLAALIKRLDLADAVRITGYVETADFARYVAAADICFNGRYPSAGETSASLLRLLGAGRAVLVSDVATFSEIPADVVAHVPIDQYEEATIAAYAQRLWSDQELRQALEDNARRYVAQHHTLAGAAQGYVQFLSELYGWGDVQPHGEPLWNVQSDQAPPSSTTANVATLIGERAAELGVQPDDVSLLERAAQRLRGLL